MTHEGEGRRRLPRGLVLLAELLLTGAVTWFILRAVGLRLEEVRTLEMGSWTLRWGLVLLSALFLLLAYLYSAGLWGRMVRELGGPAVGVVPSLRVFFTANLGRYLPGKVWQIAGLAVLGQREGVPPASATAAAILGQAFSLAGATFVALGVLRGGGTGATLGGGWVLGGGVALLLVATLPPVLRALLAVWFRLARSEVPASFAPGWGFGARWTAMYALAWLLQGAAFWVLARGLGLHLSLAAAVPAHAAAYVAGYLAVFAPAGIGVREGILIALLEPTLGAAAAALAVIARLWSTVVELLPALVLGGAYLGIRERGEGPVG